MKVLAALFLAFFLSLSAAQEVMMVPVADNIQLETTIYKPIGPGPFPLAVINHGKAPIHPRDHQRVLYTVIANDFLKRGYAVVVPMRRGYSKSTGGTRIPICDLYVDGIQQAEDISLTLDYFTRQPWVDGDNLLVIGQSYGGLATMAFGTFNYPGVKGLINFAGGLKFSSGCEWEESLIRAFKYYGAFVNTRSLWIYGQNDSFFSYELALQMEKAFLSNGGALVELVTFGPFKDDAHGLISWSEGPEIWGHYVDSYLKSVNLPYLE